MRITFLGTGTSHGIPVIGCACPVCASPDPRNRRNRTGVWIHGPARDGSTPPGGAVGGDPAASTRETGRNTPGTGAAEWSAVIDVSSEVRVAALERGLSRLDFALLTHAHADHVSGLDDLRIFSQTGGKPVPVYGDAQTLADVRARFAYAFAPPKEYGGGAPQYDLREVGGPFAMGPWNVVPLPVMHGPEPILGYRVGNFAFITDVTEIPESTLALMEGVDTLALDCLRRKPHSTHLHLEKSVAYARRIRARRTLFIHMTHELEHAETERELPDGIRLAYDGLTVEIPE